MAGWQTGLASIGNDLWGGVKDFGDIIGLDGSFGYGRTWTTPTYSAEEVGRNFAGTGSTLDAMNNGQVKWTGADGSTKLFDINQNGDFFAANNPGAPGGGLAGSSNGMSALKASGLPDAFSMGKGIFDIWNAIGTKGMMKDYYGNQTKLANEQMAMYKEDRDNIAQDKKEYTAAYGR